MMDRFVKDVLERGFVELDPNMSVTEASAKLGQEQVSFAVVNDSQSQLPSLFSAEELQRVSDQQQMVGAVAGSTAHPVPVRPDARLDLVVSALADKLIADLQIPGLVVWDEDEHIVGVVKRTDLMRVAGELKERGWDIAQSGDIANLTDSVTYYCRIDKQERSVAYYDPSDPPQCTNGHLMQRKS